MLIDGILSNNTSFICEFHFTLPLPKSFFDMNKDLRLLRFQIHSDWYPIEPHSPEVDHELESNLRDLDLVFEDFLVVLGVAAVSVTVVNIISRFLCSNC